MWPSPEDVEPPFRGKQGLELLRELIKYRAAHVVNVVDPHGRCRELLNGALDPVDFRRFVHHIIEVVERVRRGEWVVVVVDARNLPRRPRKPYCSIIWELHRFSMLGGMMVIFYTSDSKGRPRWVNADGPFIVC